MQAGVLDDEELRCRLVLQVQWSRVELTQIATRPHALPTCMDADRFCNNIREVTHRFSEMDSFELLKEVAKKQRQGIDL
jgi:hypothetical protein